MTEAESIVGELKSDDLLVATCAHAIECFVRREMNNKRIVSARRRF